MRLIRADTLTLEYFFGGRTPPYAALSHLWGADEEEIILPDLSSLEVAKRKKAFGKLQQACQQALSDGLIYIWIDTVCVDRTNSGELSEAINSMYRWFKRTSACYAYLEDVKEPSDLENSRWFTRGALLQELIAPGNLVFFNSDWEFLGGRCDLAERISLITGIDVSVLNRNHKSCPLDQERGHASKLQPRVGLSNLDTILKGFSIAEKMRWLAGRQCKRSEDLAYSLLGIMDVNLPLLYGEGALKAFGRLQEAILKTSDDHSILAFRSLNRPGPPREEGQIYTTVLAKNATQFQDNIRPEWAPTDPDTHTHYLDGELLLDLLLCHPTSSPFGNTSDHFIAFLDCVVNDNLLARPAILLRQISGSNRYVRIGDELLFKVVPEEPGSCLPILNDDSILLTDYLVKYNPSEVRRARITLTDPRSAIERHPWTTWNRPPLRFRLQQIDLNGGEYSVVQTVPERQGDYILPLPDWRLIGMIHCRSPNLESFMVTWGFSPTYPTGPWCRIWSVSTIDAPALQSTLGGIPFDSLVKSIQEEDTVVQRFLMPSDHERSKMDTSALGPGGNVNVKAEISIITFLDRDAVELQVLVSGGYREETT